MTRTTLDTSRISQEAGLAIQNFHRDTVQQVTTAIQKHPVFVVGMVGNPFVKKARKALDKAQIPYHYLEFGGYLSQWKQRLAIKLWSGWPTFPQVFVHGVLIGGATDLIQELADGRLQRRLQK